MEENEIKQFIESYDDITKNSVKKLKNSLVLTYRLNEFLNKETLKNILGQAKIEINKYFWNEENLRVKILLGRFLQSRKHNSLRFFYASNNTELCTFACKLNNFEKIGLSRCKLDLRENTSLDSDYSVFSHSYLEIWIEKRK